MSIDLSRITLQWTNTKKWGRGSGGQFHTNHCILSTRASSWCLCSLECGKGLLWRNQHSWKFSRVHDFLSLTVINRAINLKFAGTFSILRVTFSFKRRIGYYVTQVFFPDVLVVTISWIIFWLDQDDMGGRVGLGITTLLTIMFLLGSVNMSLPRVSYPKAIDWYLIGSFLFVFLVLMECILVYILRPRKPQRKNGNQKMDNGLEIDSINNLQVGMFKNFSSH